MVFHDLVNEIHKADVGRGNNSIFLSEAIRETTKECSLESSKSIKNIKAWLDRTVNTIQTAMKKFLEDDRFAYLKQEDMDVFFQIFGTTCRSIFSLDQKPSLLSMLGKFLFWSCLDKCCHDTIVESFLHLTEAECQNAQGVASQSDKMKWSLLHYCYYSIEISMKHIFKKIQHSITPKAQQSQCKTTMAKLLVRLLIAKDIIQQSIRL